MKHILLISCAAILFLSSCAPMKPIATTDFPRPFEFVIVDSVSGDKNALYVKAYEWMAKTYNSSKDIIQMSDKEAGKIIAKSVILTPTIRNYLGGILGNEAVRYTIQIDVKDGKYKCVLSDFNHEGGTCFVDGKQIHTIPLGDMNKDRFSGTAIQNDIFLRSKRSVTDQCRSIIISFKSYMKSENRGSF